MLDVGQWTMDGLPILRSNFSKTKLTKTTGFCDAPSHKRGDVTCDKFVMQSLGV